MQMESVREIHWSTPSSNPGFGNGHQSGQQAAGLQEVEGGPAWSLLSCHPPWAQLRRRPVAAAQVTLVIGACWVRESLPARAKSQEQCGTNRAGTSELACCCRKPSKNSLLRADGCDRLEPREIRFRRGGPSSVSRCFLGPRGGLGTGENAEGHDPAERDVDETQP